MRDEHRWNLAQPGKSGPLLRIGTAARFTRPLGITTYGFSGSHPDDDPMLSRTRVTDESVGINSLISGTKIMLALAIDLLAAK